MHPIDTDIALEAGQQLVGDDQERGSPLNQDKKVYPILPAICLTYFPYSASH